MTGSDGRCVDISLAMGRCAFAVGHDVPHGAAEAQDGHLRCVRWDDASEWLELPSPTGEMARIPLPWAPGYVFPDLGTTAA